MIFKTGIVWRLVKTFAKQKNAKMTISVIDKLKEDSSDIPSNAFWTKLLIILESSATITFLLPSLKWLYYKYNVIFNKFK